MRDWLLVREGLARGDTEPRPLDLDVEVHGLSARRLEGVLRKLGPVNLVGHSFAVFKLALGRPLAAEGGTVGADGAGGAAAQRRLDEVLQVDVSLPRTDSKVMPGHRGIVATGDPFLGVLEAARRRDLTVNAIAYDPLTGELEDPFDGLEDLRRGVLRAVDEGTFAEDPLRALRVAQFAARFEFEVDPSLVSLCAAIPVEELPPERVGGELRKLLLLSRAPSWGVRVGDQAGLWPRLHPALDQVDWGEVCHAVDRAARIRRARLGSDLQRAEVLLLAAFFSGVRLADVKPVLDRFDVFSRSGFSTRRVLLSALDQAGELSTELDDAALRLRASETERHGGLGVLLAVAEAIRNEPRFERLATRADQMGIGLRAPGPLVGGRDLKERGFQPGPEMGRVLRLLHRRQLALDIRDRDELLALLVGPPGFESVAPDRDGG